MLIEFTVKNYRSIKDEQVLSMVKDNGNELQETNSFSPNAPTVPPLLNSAVIYGANAAGKSNIIKAIDDMKYIVRNSAKEQEGDSIRVFPFLFDKNSAEAPTEFEVVFVNEGIKYQYGFTATKHRVFEEWLIAYPKGRPQRWFSRMLDEATDNYDYKFSDNLLGEKNTWKNTTRENALFLSTAVQLNSKQLKPVFSWFFKKLRSVNTNLGEMLWGTGFTAQQCDESEEFKAQMLKYLQSADFSIHDIIIEKEQFDPESLPDFLPDEMREKLTTHLKDTNLTEIKTVHKTQNGDLVPLDIKEESDGTQKFFSYLGPWLDILKNGYILIVDELHNSLHPKLVEYLVSLFHNEFTNPNNAQLILTTHETSILNQDVFRRDQIWFCEKNRNQETVLYPLTDFKPRKDKENLELGYLSGRYGALPLLQSVTMG